METIMHLLLIVIAAVTVSRNLRRWTMWFIVISIFLTTNQPMPCHVFLVDYVIRRFCMLNLKLLSELSGILTEFLDKCGILVTVSASK